MKRIVFTLAALCALSLVADLYLAGDSTMCNYTDRQYPQQGWGQALYRYMQNPDQLHNWAVGGRSAKSFKSEGRWQKIVDALKPGDFVIVAFGHNDANKAKKERYSSPVDYKELMRGFVNDVKAKQATLVFATSIPHSGGISKDGSGQTRVRGSAAGLGPYVAATCELGQELDVAVLDLNAYACQAFEKMGAEAAYKLYMRIAPGEYAAHPQGKKDGCHTRDTGADFFARSAVQMCFDRMLPIAALFKNPKDVVFTPIGPDGPGTASKPLKDDFSKDEIAYANKEATEPKSTTWAKGMDDDAGLAATTSVDLFTLPGAETDGQATTYPVRDRLYTQSLDGTWNFKLIPGLTATEQDWTDGFEPIQVPGNWETQGFRNPTYGNQMPELSGLYIRTFRISKSNDRTIQQSHNRFILRFDGVLFAYRVWLNGQLVGQFGSSYQMSQWNVTDKLVEGINTLRVQVLTRSKGWLFDTNDCWALAGIFRSVELYTVPKQAAIEDVVFGFDGEKADVTVKAAGVFAKVYVSLVDEDGRHAADSEEKSNPPSFITHHSSIIASPHLWSPADPYLYDLVATLVDEKGRKIQRISQKVGLRTVKLDGMSLLFNGKKTFLNGVAWNEIDTKEGRAISYRTRREQMKLMKKAGVNCIRTAHYPFGPDFYDLADEMGLLVIDEVPFGSRGRVFLHNQQYRDELLNRTRNTIGRDRNRPSVIFWTFGNENAWTKNTAACLALAKELDSSRPRGLPQIGSSQFNEMLFHPERDVDFIAGHYLNKERMESAENNAKKPMVQTEFAHACGNGFNDFERAYTRMRQHPDKWMGGCVWAWMDQCVMHPDSETEDGLSFRNQTKRPKDLRRDLPRELQGNWLDADHFLDSWGDRATDGIVYGDGTPKDGYWLLKRLYTVPDSYFTSGRDVPANDAARMPRLRADAPYKLRTIPFLRIGRALGLNQQIQSLRKPHSSCQQPYLVAPEMQTNGLVRYYLSSPNGRTAWLEGSVEIREVDGKTVVVYDLKPNDVAREREMLEVGLAFTMPAEATRVDWSGMGPLTSVPGKHQMNELGTWAMHKDDYRFAGPRAEVVYALARANKDGRATVLESGTGKVSFENVDGAIVLTECVHVAGYGGKNGPSGTRKLKAFDVKGEVKLYEATVEPGADVVPDLTYERHYGF